MSLVRAYPISDFSYVSGYAAEYNGAELVADSLNTMVVVVIQYRLGAFGMFSDPITLSVDAILSTGFLSGNDVNAQGALNAGLRE